MGQNPLLRNLHLDKSPNQIKNLHSSFYPEGNFIGNGLPRQKPTLDKVLVRKFPQYISPYPDKFLTEKVLPYGNVTPAKTQAPIANVYRGTDQKERAVYRRK